MHDLPTAYEMINAIGGMTAKKQEAQELVETIKQRFNDLANRISFNPIYKAVYLVWENPYMAAGGDSFIHSIMQTAGLKNRMGDKSRYPVLTLEELQAIQPDLLLLSSEPFPFANRHLTALKPLLPQTRILLVDGEMFSWYGSRLLKTPAYLQALRESIQ